MNLNKNVRKREVKLKLKVQEGRESRQVQDSTTGVVHKHKHRY